MPRPTLAEVYISPTKNFRVPTGPNRDVVFFGGKAIIVDPRDMPIILQRADATVEIPATQVDWLPGWLNQLDELHPPKAKLRLPDGYGLNFNGQEWFVSEHPVFRNEQGRTAEEEESYQTELRTAS